MISEVPRSVNRSDSFGHETIELLRSEVAALERELADRDARLAEMTRVAGGEFAGSNASDVPEPDTLALVARLEELLDELEKKDARVASLEEMLRLAEEAGRAEQDERAHIESWLGEIEQRLGARESEWQAANEALRQQLDEVASQRDRAEQALNQGESGYGTSEASQESYAELRQQIAELKQKLQTTAQEKEALDQRVKAAEAHAPAAPRQEQVNAEVREERLQLARERAEMARARAELERERQNAKRVPDEIDQRVQALREHLREIHERDMQKQKEQPKESLTSRLVRLWQRLDD
jgi:chromosome segregation ATPase